MIRKATAADLDICLDYAKRFHSQSIWADIPFKDETAIKTILHAISVGVIFLNEDGFIGAIPAPLLFNDDYKIAYELFWFAGSNGRELIRAYEKWAEEKDAMPLMVCLEDERVETMSKYYQRMGYTPTERYFVKRR